MKGLRRGYKVSFVDGNLRIENTRRNLVFLHSFRVSGTEISCGVQQVAGVIRDSRMIELKKACCVKDCNIDDFVKDLYKFVFDDIKRRYNAGFIVMSNNSLYPKANKVLDSISRTKSRYMQNPNSGHNIKVWTF